jgi:DNA-binding winged helix-turn-helix (wHTH) protein/TolB-like protein/Tfp pilus assembly protein PilF
MNHAKGGRGTRPIRLPDIVRRHCFELEDLPVDARVHPISQSAAAGNSQRYQLLDLELDVGRQTVSRGGIAQHVPKLSFDLLLALTRAAPNMMSVQELMEQVWPRQVVGVETVTQRVKLLRKALGDSASQPRYVVGERRRGYRILAPVVILSPVPGPPVAGPAAHDELLPIKSLPSPSSRLARGLAISLCALVAGLLIASLIWIERERRPPAHIESASPNAVTPPFSVAVLPFRTAATAENNALVAAGLADLVRIRLSSERELTIIATSVDHPGESPLEAAARVGARYAVYGTVQYEDQGLRVAADVLEAPTGHHVGSVLIERPTRELYRLQDDIADRIASLVLGRTRVEGPLAPEYGSEAMLAYLRGRALLATRKVADADTAVDEFSRAAQLAPTFAAAHAGIAEARFQRAFLVNAFDENAARLYKEMAASIDQALKLDPDNGPALFIRAKYRELYTGAEAARQDYERAMSLAPSFSPGVAYYADFLEGRQGDMDKALVVLDAGIRLDPLAPRLIYMKGMMLQSRHEDDAAAALLLQTIRVDPQYSAAYNRLSELRWAQGRDREALSFAEQSVHIDPASAWGRGNLARIYIDLGELTAAADVLNGFEMQSAYGIEALGCYRDGNLNAAYGWLQQTLENPHVDGSVAGLAASLTALVEWAEKSRRFAAARQRLLSMRWLKNAHGELDYTYTNAMPLLQLATLEHLAGNQDGARDLAQRVLDISDAPGPAGGVTPRYFTGAIERNRMLALAILGRDEEALAQLAKIRDGLARQLWWVWIERHPALARLRRDPRLQAILVKMRAWALQERASVQAERAAGRLPARTGVAYRCVAPPAVTQSSLAKAD